MNHLALLKQQALFAGKWQDATTGETLNVFNPATQALLGTVPDLQSHEVEAAIIFAEQAGAEWRQLSAYQRSALLKKWHALVVAHTHELAEILTLEQGKPLAEAKGEIAYSASYIEWYAEEALRMYGQTIPGPASKIRIYTLQQPVGLCAAIAPWNFPAAMLARKAAPALAAGCTMLMKPDPQTPFSALALAYLAEQAGIPAGVLSVLTGDAARIGVQLTADTRIRKLSFTGSTRVGALLMSQSAPSIKKLSLELGGHAPFIVFEDADIDKAVQGAIASKFRNAGQTCVCTNRFYVHQSVYEAFTTQLKTAMQALTLGHGLDENTQIGPLINQAAADKVQRHIDDAIEQGAELLLGGKTQRLAGENGGIWFEPTLLGKVPAQALCAREETFGPVAPIFTFENEAEVIKAANQTEFGLAAYLFTENISRVHRVSEALEVGMVGVNTGLISTAAAPFGGIKSSGLGREGGQAGLTEYTELKYINLSL